MQTDNALDLVVKCKISHQCLYFCRSHVQKSAKKLVFTVFYRILTNFEMTQTLGIWYVDNTHALVCPCIISRRCFYFCRSHVQKSTKKCIFTAFYSILSDFKMTQRLEIWYVNTPPNRVCSSKISSQYHLFCRSYVRKRHFYSIFTAFYQKALHERFHRSRFQFSTDIGYTKPLRNPE